MAYPKVVVSVSFPPDLYNKVKAAAIDADLPVSVWIKDAVAKQLELDGARPA